MRKINRCAIVVSTGLGTWIGFGLGGGLVPGTTSHASGQTLSFTNEADALGLTFTHTRGPRYGFMGAGGVAADFNNDGFVDLFVLGGGDRADALFINNGPDGSGNFSFTDQAAAWDVDFLQYSFGASAGDFNNDGLIDIYITSYGPADGIGDAGMNKLLVNLGPGAGGQWSFIDQAEICGVNLLEADLTDGTGSAWGDYDLDGDLDLVVCAYERTAMGNRLFRNDGIGLSGVVEFTDVTEESGLLRSGIQGFVPGFADMNGDRYPELLLVADAGTSEYLINNGDGTFTAATDTVEGLSAANGMGSAVGDINLDGMLDWYVSGSFFDFLNGPGNVLMIQEPDGSFWNASPGTPVHDGGWGWGVLMVDFNHDGLLDLAETNGFATGYTNEQSYLYINHGDLNFTEEGLSLGYVHYGQGRGLVDFDFDNDGDRDLVIFSTGEPMAVFENHLLEPGQEVPAGVNWVDLRFDTSMRDTLAPMGLGAHITILSGGQERIFYADGGFNHCSQSELGVHLGLGEATMIDAVRIQWTDGSFQTLTDVPANQRLTVVAPFHPADLDGSGAVDINDVMAFIGGYSKGDLSSDHNGDGVLDVFDMLLYLGDFSSAP
jgi:enediyne biosynthesis protein E4